jgi:hypothetical protein
MQNNRIMCSQHFGKHANTKLSKLLETFQHLMCTFKTKHILVYYNLKARIQHRKNMWKNSLIANVQKILKHLTFAFSIIGIRVCYSFNVGRYATSTNSWNKLSFTIVDFGPILPIQHGRPWIRFAREPSALEMAMLDWPIPTTPRTQHSWRLQILKSYHDHGHDFHGEKGQG